MKVASLPTGEFAVVGDDDKVVAGPFASNAEAWRAMDRLEGQPLSPAEKRNAFVTDKILKAGPAPKMPSKKRKRQLRQAAKAPGWLRTGAAAHFNPRGDRQHRDYKLGTFGPASEVRHVDPSTIDISKYGVKA